MNDAELEEAFRASLRTRAADVDVPPGLVARAGAARPRRRRTAVWAAVGAAAAVVVVSLGLQAVHLPSRQEQGVSDRGSATSSSSDPDSSASSSTGDAAGWREESWHGLQVEVPADWGWGTAPIRQGGQPYLCGGPGAKVLTDGRDLESADADAAYVGRPIMLSDACQGGDVITGAPAAPYVWLGADLPAGTVDLGNGYTRQTVESHGTTLSVATTDAGLRRQILHSATAAGCSVTEVDPLPHASDEGSNSSIGGAQLCVYQRDQDLQLVYATSLDAAQAIAYVLRSRDDVDLDRALTGSPRCASDEVVVVRVQEFDGKVAGVAQSVLDPVCDWLSVTPGRRVQLGGRTQQLIARIGGLRAVLHSQVGSVG